MPNEPAMSGAASSTPRPTLSASPGKALTALDQIVEETCGRERGSDGFLDRFLAERSLSRALKLWLSVSPPVRDPDQLVASLNRDVATIDRLINQQVNAILHHPAFQRLESSWRGLDFLVRQAAEYGDPSIKIKVLNASWTDLERDFDRAIEFDQSQLFRKVYENEFGSPGGEPIGVLIGDYEIRHRPGGGYRHDDLRVLESIAGVAAAAFCPFIANASPAFFGLDDFEGLQQTLDHARTMEQMDYLKWRAFRDSEDARFVGLALPRILMRLPWQPDNNRIDGFNFTEDVSGPGHSGYLWGGAAFAMGSVIMRAFADAAWPADVRGVRRGVDSGGLVTGLLAHEFGTDSRGVSHKSTTDVVITDRLEKQLSDVGFIPLCHCYDTSSAAFYSVPSVQKPKVYDRKAPTNNARISSTIQYMLCVSRFAHYIKAMGRDRIGSFTQSDQFERFLQDWLTQYVVLDDHASTETKARYPLREARVQVRAKPGSSGAYQCVIHLVPHYELDDVTASVRLTTEIAPPRSG